jgi:hypothetical protein
MRKAYRIDCEKMGVSYQDSGPCRSYELSAAGNDHDSMLSTAQVVELSQDGIEMAIYPLSNASLAVQRRGHSMIGSFWQREYQSQIERARALTSVCVAAGVES